LTTNNYTPETAREDLENFLDIFVRYRSAIFPSESNTELKAELSQKLQRKGSRIARILVDILGNETIQTGSYGQVYTLDTTSLIPTAVAGGSSEAAVNFRDFDAPVRSAVNRAIGKIDSGDWPMIATAGEVDSTIDLNGPVFIVHGADHGARDKVARFLEKLKVNYVILDEQPNRGKTIVEKLEEFGGASFSIVLLTGDDIGGPSDKPTSQQLPRARQNVILELGYFMGRLGRDRVAALYQEGTEIPNDYAGVAYIPFDKDDAWNLRMARELRSAGVQFESDDLV